VFIKGSIRGDEAEGNATIYRLADGSLVLRLESFITTNGPDLVVAAHPAANPEEQPGPYLVIAGLKGNQGNQNYELPADFDPRAYGSIVIWCRTFDVVFGYAALTAL
jgi:Electron transfer DM13